jgi:hypothetical protein
MKLQFYPGQIRILTDYHDKMISYDQQVGLFTRKEWDEELNQLDIGLTVEERNQILNALEQRSNVPFFAAYIRNKL